MDQPDQIHLRDHVVTAEIGAFQSERGQHQRLRFDICVDLHGIADSRDDHVDSILSYDILVQAVRHALNDRRYNLIETLAERIAAEVLAHPRAASITVRVEKLDRVPGALGITITRSAARISIDPVSLPVRVILWQAPAAISPGATIILPDTPGLPLPEGGDRRRISLLALDQAALALAGRLGLEIVATRTEMQAAIHAAQPVVWAPAGLAADHPALGADPLALGCWLASRLSIGQIDISLPAGHPLPAAPAGSATRIRRIATCQE